MSGLLEVVLANALAAGILASGAWVASRHVRRQSLVHALWVLALVKLVTPPLVELPVLPEWGGAGLFRPTGPTLVIVQDGTTAPGLTEGDDFEITSLLEGHVAATGNSPSRNGGTATDMARPVTGVRPSGLEDPATVLAPWLLWTTLALGALTVVGVAGFRVRRFRRLLGYATPAPASLQDRASALARRVGLDRAPPVRLLPARVPPMLWPGRRGPALLLPSELLPGLTDEERDTLLVHELAHVRRRDHWVRMLELVVTVTFWWYPVAWWVRRALRQAEERCCDEWVLRVMPGSARAYAEGLLKSLDFVAAEPDPLPVGASGAGPVGDLESRLKEILMSTRPLPRLKAPVRVVLALIAALGLAVFPTRAQTPGPDPEVVPSENAPGAEEVELEEPQAPDGPQVVPPAAPVALEAPKAPDAPPAALPRLASPAVAVPLAPAPAVTTPVSPAPAVLSPRPAVAPPPAPRPVVSPGPTPRVGPAPRPSAIAPRPVPAPHPVVVPQELPEDDDVRRDIQARRRALEAQRAELQRHELEVARQQAEQQSRAEQEHLRAEADRLRAAGEDARATLVEEQARVAARRAAVVQQELALEQARAAGDAQRQKELQAIAERQATFEREGKEAEADALRLEMAEIEDARLRADLEREEKRVQLQRETFEIQQQARRVQREFVQQMQERSRKDTQARMKDEERRLARERTLGEKEMRARKAAQALRATELQIMEREAAGQQAEAEALRADAERMRSELEALHRGLQEEHLLQASAHLEQQVAAQLEALRDIQAEGASDRAQVEKEIARLEAALEALRSPGE